MMLLEMLAMERRPLTGLLSRLEKRYGPHHYGRIDTHFPLEKRAALMSFCKEHPPARLGRSPVTAVRTYDGVKFCAKDGSWLMLRGSGTEPVLRIYAESPSATLTQRLLREGIRLTRQI